MSEAGHQMEPQQRKVMATAAVAVAVAADIARALRCLWICSIKLVQGSGLLRVTKSVACQSTQGMLESTMREDIMKINITRKKTKKKKRDRRSN